MARSMHLLIFAFLHKHLQNKNKLNKKSTKIANLFKIMYPVILEIYNSFEDKLFKGTSDSTLLPLINDFKTHIREADGKIPKSEVDEEFNNMEEIYELLK